MNGDLKQTFIIKCLHEFFQEAMSAMQQNITRKKALQTGEGLKSIAYQAATSGAGAAGQLKFKEYLRFVDMGVGKGHPLGSLTIMKETLQASKKPGPITVKDNAIKPRKIYAKPVYTRIGFLMNKLLNGFTEETIATLKQELQTQQNGAEFN